MDPERPKKYGFETLVRPNRNRKKTTVYLAPEDWERIQTVKDRTGEKTAAGAIRAALKLAIADPPETVSIGHRILTWATGLQFKTDRETRELHDLSGELYEVAGGVTTHFP